MFALSRPAGGSGGGASFVRTPLSPRESTGVVVGAGGGSNGYQSTHDAGGGENHDGSVGSGGNGGNYGSNGATGSNGNGGGGGGYNGNGGSSDFGGAGRRGGAEFGSCCRSAGTILIGILQNRQEMQFSRKDRLP